MIFLTPSHWAIAQPDNELWLAHGESNTYGLLQSLTGARPQVPCAHNEFTDEGHIDQVFDSDLKKNVFRFLMHANEDGNYRNCSGNQERQRNELAYNTVQPPTFVVYRWLMKLPADFSTPDTLSYNFTHLHQLKLRDGAFSSQPMFTLSAANNELILITSTSDFFGDTVLVSASLDEVRGQWVEVSEMVLFDQSPAQGRYGIQVKRRADRQLVMEFVSNQIQTWKGGATELQVKWGLYRTRTGFGGGATFSGLKDEQVLFDQFSVNYLPGVTTVDFLSLFEDGFETLKN